MAEQDPPRHDTSYEVVLDDEDQAATRKPVYVDVISRDHELVPIIPANLRSVAGIKKTVKRHVRLTAHRCAVHAVRLPFLYLPLAVFWGVVGLFKLLGRQIKWWWVTEQHQLRQMAAATGDAREWDRLNDKARQIRLFRGLVLLGELVAVAVGVAALAFAPGWVTVVVVLTALPGLAHLGRPAHKPIVHTAVVTRQARRINSDVVLRAYYAAGLGHPEKPNQQVEFGGRMSRDAADTGSQVPVVLPFGGTYADAVKVKASIASGLDVTVQQVFLTKAKKSEREHLLFVADEDPLAAPAGRTDLLDGKPRSIWQPMRLGRDERDQLVTLYLMWISLMIGAQPRKGKALALDTKVPTPTGWTTMGELHDGDWVYDEAGKPCRVVTAHDVLHGRPCYEVHFSDGSVIVADADHLWQVDTRGSRLGAQQQDRWRKAPSPFSRDQQHKRSLPQVLTTADMLGSVRIQASRRANYSVRVAAPLQAEDADLLVPPYTLGAWLGDGTSIHGAITCADAEIIARIGQEGERTGLNPSSVKNGGCPYYRVYGLQPRLRTIGVLGNKHIPTAYLRASEQQRRALLAGLLDTDGFCQQGTGVVYFSVTSERLARDVRHLVSTLGYKSTLNVKPVKFNGRDHGYQWVVTFTPADRVFGLARKASRQVTSMKASAGHRFITEIRPVASVPVRCITVDSPNSLYLAGETCIPTHNTFTARLVALYAALDPYVKLILADGKKSTDWDKFRLVAHRMIVGTHPNPRDSNPIEHLLDALDEILAHIDRVNDVLAQLPVDLCPEGVLTEALARDPRFPDLRVWLLILEEFQVYFETEDQEVNKQVAAKLSRIQATGPSAGVIVISSSQKPSGVGAGDVGRLFNRYRDNHTVRFALKCGNREVSMAVLGGDAYQEGYDASALPIGLEYRGVGYLYGASDATPTTRTFLADHVDAEKILIAARGHREQLGTLSGLAAGEAAERAAARDVLGDVIRVFAHLGRKQLQWEQLAEILADQLPQVYAQETKDSVSALVRAEGVPNSPVRAGDSVLQGCKLEHVRQAVERKAVSA